MEVAVKPTENKLFAETVVLSGHKAAVLACKFAPNGRLLASVSQDKSLLLWDVFDSHCKCQGSLTGHKGAVTDLHWSILDDSKVITSSADRSLAVFDLNEWVRVKRLQGHTAIVNTCHGTTRGGEIVISGADDGKAKLWDMREKVCTHTWDIKLPVTSVQIDEFGISAYVACIDSAVQVWDVRQGLLRERLEGHSNAITGLALSPDGSYLLSNSLDETMRCWDIRPYVPKLRCLKIYESVPHSYETALFRCAWASDGSVISAGSSDRLLHIWDSSTRQKTQSFAGHNGCVFTVDFHPEENIIASGSADSYVILGYY